MRSKAAKVALCGVVSALSVVLMLMTGIVPIATIALPALAGCLTIAIVAETNVRYGFAVYCVVSVLAILLTPDREAILFYILFFGYYPTLYGLLMRIKRKPLRVLAKFGVFNLAMALETALALSACSAAACIASALAVWVLQIPLSEMEVFGKWSIPILAVMLNVVFVLYDYSMNGLIVLYIRRLHPLVQKYIK